MGSHKAFLTFGGKPFIPRISEEMPKMGGDVLVVVGIGQAIEFESALGGEVRVFEDDYDLNSPMGGTLLACSRVRSEYVAFLACDMPLAKSLVILPLYHLAHEYSAAIPRLEKGDLEPPCAAYDTEEARLALLAALRDKNLISLEHFRTRLTSDV